MSFLRMKPFDPDPTCNPGGFYFAKEEHIMEWYYLYVNPNQFHDEEEKANKFGFNTTPKIPLIAEVTLCEDSRVVEMETKLKTDKFILGKPYPITDYLVRCRFSDPTDIDPFRHVFYTPYFKRTTYSIESDIHHKIINLQTEVRTYAFIAKSTTAVAGIALVLLLANIISRKKCKK